MTSTSRTTTTSAAGSALPILRKALRDSRGGLLGWLAGHIGAILLYLPFFPSIGANADMQAFFTDFPPEVVTLFGLDQMGSGSAYTQATYFGLTAFLLLAIAAIGWGASAIAGDEESGSLELTLAHGVGRTQVVLERTLAIVVRVVVIVVVAAGTIWLLNGPSELDLTAPNLAAVSLALFGLALVVGMASLAAGAISGRRSVATAFGAGVAVLAYVLDAVAKTTGIEWLGTLSPMSWAFGNLPLQNGFDWRGVALLLGLATLLLVTALVAFRRRDVGR